MITQLSPFVVEIHTVQGALHGAAGGRPVAGADPGASIIGRCSARETQLLE